MTARLLRRVDDKDNEYEAAVELQPALPGPDFAPMVEQMIERDKMNIEAANALKEKLVKMAKKRAKLTMTLDAQLKTTESLAAKNKETDGVVRKIMLHGAVITPNLDPDSVINTLKSVLDSEKNQADKKRRELDDLNNQLAKIAPKDQDMPDVDTLQAEADKNAKKLKDLKDMKKNWLADLPQNMGKPDNQETRAKFANFGKAADQICDLADENDQLQRELDELKKKLDVLQRENKRLHDQLQKRLNDRKKLENLQDDLNDKSKPIKAFRKHTTLIDMYNVLNAAARKPRPQPEKPTYHRIGPKAYELEKKDNELDDLEKKIPEAKKEQDRLNDKLRQPQTKKPRKKVTDYDIYEKRQRPLDYSALVVDADGPLHNLRLVQQRQENELAGLRKKILDKKKEMSKEQSDNDEVLDKMRSRLNDELKKIQDSKEQLKNVPKPTKKPSKIDKDKEKLTDKIREKEEKIKETTIEINDIKRDLGDLNDKLKDAQEKAKIAADHATYRFEFNQKLQSRIEQQEKRLKETMNETQQELHETHEKGTDLTEQEQKDLQEVLAILQRLKEEKQIPAHVQKQIRHMDRRANQEEPEKKAFERTVFKIKKESDAESLVKSHVDTKESNVTHEEIDESKNEENPTVAKATGSQSSAAAPATEPGPQKRAPKKSTKKHKRLQRS